MNALSQEARALIDSVAAYDDPSGSDKARVRARLAAELGAAALVALAVTSASGTTLAISAATPSAAAASATAQGTAASLFGKLAVASAVLLAIASGLWLGASKSRRVDEPPRAQVVASQSLPEAPAAAAQRGAEPTANGAAAEELGTTAASAEQAPPERQASPVRMGRSERAGKGETVAGSTQKAAPAASTLGLELKLLGAAQAALRAGAPERALVLTAEHRASFPEGVMKEERLGIEALAGCALGRDYRAQAEAFLASAHSSPLRTHVQKACGIEP
jgi:hypothetical protein